MTPRTIVLTLLALAATAQARADCKPSAPKLVGAARDRVGLYSESGKFEREVEKAALVEGAAVLDCNEDLGLVKVKLREGAEAWVDKAEVKLAHAAGDQARPCVVSAANRPHDKMEPVVSGFGGKDCDPAQAGKK